MDGVDVRGVLAAIPLFAETLDQVELDHLAAESRVVVFPAGALVMAEGDFGASMFAIVEGSVAVTLHDRRGDERGVAELHGGEFFGEMSLLTGQRRSATVVASTDLTAIEITKVVLEELFARSPELIDRFGGVLAGRQAQLSRIAADVPGHRADVISQIRRFFARPRR